MMVFWGFFFFFNSTDHVLRLWLFILSIPYVSILLHTKTKTYKEEYEKWMTASASEIDKVWPAKLTAIKQVINSY